ncbi:hypothetical protein BpHYR1_019809 [Brachionus plicatilis]|uniref:Uncharacterized protein n=1 Tax=Brachionus plicatilis TaxID=10195 RepID=A0A3M7SYI1_BRAPC|nr:hypothetical protein BpHYR1_019809 [Brachionus plicatilis]
MLKFARSGFISKNLSTLGLSNAIDLAKYSGQNMPNTINRFAKYQNFVAILANIVTTGTGDIGSCTGPMPSHHEYSALSELIMVQHAPSLMSSRLGSLAHGVD